MANKTADEVLISFEKLGHLLDKKGLKWQYLRENGISPGIVAKMKDGSGHTDTRTIQKVCALLGCQPGQIMEYLPGRRQENTGEKQIVPGIDNDDLPDFMKE